MSALKGEMLDQRELILIFSLMSYTAIQTYKISVQNIDKTAARKRLVEV